MLLLLILYLFAHVSFSAILAMVRPPHVTPLEVGLRVIRGPDWRWGDQDGGEGGVGTVVEVARGTQQPQPQSAPTPEGTVIVQWDSGARTNYRTGHQGSFDLRALDAAPCGVRQDASHRCSSCGASAFYGLRWRCVDCSGEDSAADLCQVCYGLDRHDLRHRFRRFDSPSSPGTYVAPPRAESRRVAFRGAYPGARVRRSFDWVWKDQDGGPGGAGEVLGTEGWEGESGRSVVQVRWASSGQVNHYRLGHKGKLDVQLCPGRPGAVVGGYCYPDHLPVLGKAEPVNWSPKHSREFTLSKFDVGDRVKISVGVDVLRTLQEGHGGFHAKMADLVGAAGRVHRITAAGDIRVQYPGKVPADHRWTVHPAALSKAANAAAAAAPGFFRVGELVRVIDDEAAARRLQDSKWTEGMREALGSVARVTGRRTEGGGAEGGEDVEIQTESGGTFAFKPACLASLEAQGGGAAARSEPTSPLRENLSPSAVGGDDFVRCAAKGDAKDVREYLGSRQRPIPTQVRKALLIASKHARLEVLKILAERFPEEVGSGSEEAGGKTALHVAAHQGHLDAADLLLCSGASPNARDSRGETPVHAAVRARQATTVTFLLERGGDAGAGDVRGRTPLHAAASLGYEMCASALLGPKNSDPNAKDREGNTPMHEAVGKDQPASMIELLHSSGAKPSAANRRNFNCAHLAALKGHSAALEAVLRLDPSLAAAPKADGITPLHLACLNGRLEAAAVLLSRGEKASLTSARDRTGRTALHHASARGFHYIAEALLRDGGASACSKDFEGVTPLHLALEGDFAGGEEAESCSVNPAVLDKLEVAGVPGKHRRRVALASLLITHGADATAADKEGRSPFDLVKGPEERAFLLELSLLSKDNAEGGKGEGGEGKESPEGLGTKSSDGVGNVGKRSGKSIEVECAVCSESCVPVVFRPCGHKVACVDCSARMKKCLECKQPIGEKEAQRDEDHDDDDDEGAAAAASGSSESEEANRAKALRDLEAKVRDLEECSLCLICMERRRNVAFLCGHQACSQCGESLAFCHMCREPVGRKIYLYS